MLHYSPLNDTVNKEIEHYLLICALLRQHASSKKALIYNFFGTFHCYDA